MFMKVDAIAVLVAAVLWAFLSKWNMRRKMPPGPLGLPFIGNRHQMPKVKPWRKFAEWNRQYGPVASIFLGSTPVIVLGTADAAWDLLEKRSDIYSSRPRFIMAGELLSNNLRGLMLPNNETWRKWRRVLHSGLHIHKAETYKEIQSLESKLMMHQILENPKDYEKHLQRYAASAATSVTYGRRVDSVDDWVVKENIEAVDHLVSFSIPGKYIVESLPWLLKLPQPLQWFRAAAEKRRQHDISFLTYLLDDVKRRVQGGAIPDCLAAQTLAEQDKHGMSDLEIAYTVSSPFGAGIETTAGTMVTFFLAMLHFPETMRKAQTELDRVVGDRMPEYSDKRDLPYVNALINETLRWRPVAALGGTPHAVTVDDEYNGMFIPKGSTVYANLSGIMHDPIMFPSPDTFRPERFLEADNPRLQAFDLPFGWGRRQCPGMHFASNSLFINISRILWAFDISPGADGIPDSWRFTNGFNSKPVSFECTIKPRRRAVAECIEMEWEQAKPRLVNWQQSY